MKLNPYLRGTLLAASTLAALTGPVLGQSPAVDCSEATLANGIDWQAGDPVDQPHEVNYAFGVYFNSGDLDRLMSLYDDRSVMIAQPGGTPLVGIDAIRGSLGWLMSTGGKLEADRRHCLISGDTALLSITFELKGAKDQNGNAMEVGASTSEVVRRRTDGTWVYAVDHVFGAE